MDEQTTSGNMPAIGLVVVSGGVAYVYSPKHVLLKVVDVDNIKGGDLLEALPPGIGFEELVKEAQIENFVTFEEDDDKEPMHVYEWLNLPSASDGERDAKEWLDKFTLPAYDKYNQGIQKWLDQYHVTVEWKGSRYLCSGASRLGDIWLREEGSKAFYDHRVLLEELSNWERTKVEGSETDEP
jgi:hypothetical protein